MCAQKILAHVLLTSMIGIMMPIHTAFAVSTWNPTLLVNTESFQQIDVGDGTTSVDLQFGATTSTLKLLSAGTFQFNKSLSVVGGISGSYLTVDHQANISGALLVKSTITSKSTVSGANLTFMGATSSYILGKVGIGKTAPKVQLEVAGTLSGKRLSLTSDQAVSTGALYVRQQALATGALIKVDQAGRAVLALDSAGQTSASPHLLFGYRGSFDTNLFRVSPAFLKTDGSFAAQQSLSGSSFFGAGLGDCNNQTTSKLIYNASTGKFACATDQTGGGTSGGSGWSNTGSLQSAFDTRFVNQHGDTMTGTLTIRSASGTTAVNLNVAGTMSGRGLQITGTGANSLLYTNIGAGKVVVGSGSRAVTLENRGDFITRGPWLDIRAFGAVADGVTDAAPAIQSAIDHLASNGGTSTGGTVFIPPGPFAIGTGIILKTDVLVKLSSGTEVKWTGALNGTMFTTGTSVPTLRTGVVGERGAKVRPMTKAAYVFDLHSVQFSQFGNFEITNGLATTTAFRLRADAAATTGGYKSKRNVAFNEFGPALVNGNIGTVIDMGGQDSAAVVTLNTFNSIEAADVKVIGIRIVQWSDNNQFVGRVRLSLTASNAIGVIFNDSATPTAEVGVYSNTFSSLSVDTFAGSSTARMGLVFNDSKRTTIYNYHNNPEAESGSIVDNSSESRSYYVVDTSMTNNDGKIDIRHKGLRFSGSLLEVKGTLSGSALTFMGGTGYILGRLGIGTTAPQTKLEVDGGLALSTGSLVTLTADSQTVTVGDRSYIRFTSDSTTSTQRSFVLTRGTVAGQILILEWTHATNEGELGDDSSQSGGGTTRLSAVWPATTNQLNDTLVLISNGTDWVEMDRSAN